MVMEKPHASSMDKRNQPAPKNQAKVTPWLGDRYLSIADVTATGGAPSGTGLTFSLLQPLLLEGCLVEISAKTRSWETYWFSKCKQIPNKINRILFDTIEMI